MAASDEHALDLLVQCKQAVADGVVLLTLRDPAGRPLPEWQPGATSTWCSAQKLVRQYSLCGDPADRTSWQVAVLREPAGRGGSQYIHDELGEGDTVRVRGPRNHFELAPSKRYLFIAGGIGITPILPMLTAAQAAGAEWRLVYGGRSRSSMAFRDQLQSYPDYVRLCPQDETGLLDLDELLGEPAEHTLVYCCGPEPLLAAVEERCAAWPDGALRVERFAPKAMDEPVRQNAFEVELFRAELTLTVPPQQSILRAVEEAGVAVLSSCTEAPAAPARPRCWAVPRITATRCSPRRSERPAAR